MGNSAVISYSNNNLIADFAKNDFNMVWECVFDGIGYRFLSNAVKLSGYDAVTHGNAIFTAE